MTILVTDTGFAADDVPLAFVPLGDAANDTPALHLASDTNLTDLPDRLAGVRAIRINFPSFADGRACRSCLVQFWHGWVPGSIERRREHFMA